MGQYEGFLNLLTLDIEEYPFWAYVYRVYRDEMDLSSNERYWNRASYPVYQRDPYSREIEFPVEWKAFAELHEKKLGLNVPYACIAARTASYNAKDIGDDSEYNFRNMDFLDYRAAIGWLKTRNITAVRMGRVLSPITGIENCIDYGGAGPDDIMDLWLIKNCRFLLGSACGIVQMAGFLSIPVCVVNAVLISMGGGGMGCTQFDLCIPKKYYDKNKKRYLSLREIRDVEYECYVFGSKYENLGIQFIDNTQEEIRMAVEEFLDRLEGRWKDTEEDERNYYRYMEIYDEWVKNAVAEEDGEWKGTPVSWRIASTYLRDNQYLLE